jgi:hypothetical protein
MIENAFLFATHMTKTLRKYLHEASVGIKVIFYVATRARDSSQFLGLLFSTNCLCTDT